MRQRIAALTAAATLVLAGTAPAFADSEDAIPAPSTTSLFTCTATATVSKGSKVLYNAASSFTSPVDVSNGYTRTYTINGVTYTVTANVTCTK